MHAHCALYNQSCRKQMCTTNRYWAILLCHFRWQDLPEVALPSGGGLYPVITSAVHAIADTDIEVTFEPLYVWLIAIVLSRQKNLLIWFDLDWLCAMNSPLLIWFDLEWLWQWIQPSIKKIPMPLFLCMCVCVCVRACVRVCVRACYRPIQRYAQITSLKLR